jgi:ABC-type proline/glycine betaine transport system ATPase subunit
MHTVELGEITLDRLELLTHAQLMERNTVHRYPEPLKQAIRQRAGLVRSIRHRVRSTTA